MAHQLDFCVTVSCDSQEALLQLERMLKLGGAGPLFLGQPVFSIVREFRSEMSELTLEIHSVDINWDDANEPVAICQDCAAKAGLDVGDYPLDPPELCAYCGENIAVCKVID